MSSRRTPFSGGRKTGRSASISHGQNRSGRRSASPPAKKPLLGVGDKAPDFELVGADGQKHRLSSFRGRRVLLSFFRYAA